MGASVVICAYTMDRWADLVGAVRSCATQTLRPTEAILVVDYNEELRLRALREFPDVKVVANRSIKGLSGARNTGVVTATGDVIAFLDDDAFADDQWLEEMVRPLSDPRVAGVGGWIVPNWPAEPPSWFPETFYWILGCSYAGLPTADATIRNPIGASMAMRSSVFERVGGFTSGIGRVGLTPLGCEETELCIRYNAVAPNDRFVLATSAVVHHRVPVSRLTWSYFWRRCWAEGLSKAAVASLVGADSGLASERRHVLVSLPAEIARSLRMAVRDPRNAVVRATLIVAGTAFAAAGLVRGRIALRRSPITVGSADLELLANAEIGSNVGTGSVGPRDVERRTSTTTPPSSSPGLDGAPKSVNDLSPVTLIRVDIDNERGPVKLDAAPGDRIWVEVFKHRQMVGAVEVRAERGGLSVGAVSDLAQRFADAPVTVEATVTDDALPSASVVVPTICRYPDELVRTVDALLDQDYPNFEVIVVDNRVGEHPPLPEFRDDPRIRTVRESRPGASSARNRGVSLSNGSFIAFTDDDAAVDPGWLRALGTRFALDESIDAIGGLVRPLELDTRPQLWFEEFYGGFTRSFSLQLMSNDRVGVDDVLFPYDVGRFGAGNNMAMRRSTLDRIGGFDPRLGVGTPTKGGEDPGAFLKIIASGGTVAFEPAALVRHSHRRTQHEFMVQVFGYGTGLTAMLTSIILDDPRHVVAIAKRLPAAARLIARPASERSTSLAPSYPRRTVFYQLAGMAYGPVALVRSMLQSRRYR